MTDKLIFHTNELFDFIEFTKKFQRRFTEQEVQVVYKQVTQKGFTGEEEQIWQRLSEEAEAQTFIQNFVQKEGK